MNKHRGANESAQPRGRVAALERRVRQGQLAALVALDLLAKALAPELLDGEPVAETGSEQVARSDRAMREAMAHLARIVDPDALSQEQAERTVQRLRESGLSWQAGLRREWEATGIYGARGLLAALRQLVAALRLHQDLDCCCCNELAGSRCPFCTTGDALDVGERWLALLDQQRRPDSPSLDEGLCWSFGDLDLVYLIDEARREALVQGYYLDADLGSAAEEEVGARLAWGVQQVLAPLLARVERVDPAGDSLPFLRAFVAYWLRRGRKLPRSAAVLSSLQQPVHLQVNHAAAPDLDWETTQPALQLSILLPGLLLHILSESSFEGLTWLSGGVRYRLRRAGVEWPLSAVSSVEEARGAAEQEGRAAG